VISGELPPNEASFPNRNERGSADQLAWLAGLVSTFMRPGHEGVAKPLLDFIEATHK
jgi:hypothetical protein